MHRQVVGLLWAAKGENPWSKEKRKKGTKAQGLAYQKAVAKALPQAKPEVWFSFIDANGKGNCSPDLLLPLTEGLLVLECKRTDWPDSHTQVSQLYLPVLAKATGRKVWGVVVAKNLSHKTDRSLVCENLSQALFLARQGLIPVLHLPWPTSGHPCLKLGPSLVPALAPQLALS